MSKITNELIRLLGYLKFSEWITPLNDSSEKKKFFKNYNKGKVYNPQYEYKRPKSLKKINELLNRLLSASKDKLEKDIIDRALLKVKFVESISNGSSQIYIYGKPDPAFVALAKQLIPKQKATVQKRNLSAKEAKTSFLEYLKGYRLWDWKVKIKRKMVAKANVEPSKKILYIKNRNYSLHEINNLIAHEIEVHVLRTVNGFKQKNKVFGIGTGDYLKTEEGLAIMMEQLTGNYNPQRFKFFCARIIATDMVVSKSFYEIFDALHKKYNLSKHNAYIITKRVKRGLKDTSLPGGYIKDHVYFEGFQMMEKFMQGGGDIRPLFAGKISLSEINLVKKGILKPPSLIPKAVESHYQYRSKQKVLI